MLRFGLSARLLPQSRLGFGTNVRKLSIFEKYPPKVGLYDKALEKDSCGVGLVANLKKVASRRVVVDANQMLVRMSHRGGCGCEPNSGDGAGKPRCFDIRTTKTASDHFLGLLGVAGRYFGWHAT